jgi:RNA polymerase sigma factor (sigma-70 family)
MVEPDQTQATHLAGPAPTPEPAGDPIPWKDVQEFARGVARNICGRRYDHLVDDIAQESAVRLWKNHGRITKDWKAFLYKIVWNQALKQVGREKSLGSLLRGDSASLEGAPDNSPGPLTEAVEGELKANLEVVLDELEVRFGLGTRAIVEFRSEGMTWGEIVEALGIPLRTCTLRYQKAEAWTCKRLSLSLPEGGGHE